MKKCPKCQETKDLSYFYILKSGKNVGKPSGYCKDCHSASMKERYKRPGVANKIAIVKRKWRLSNADHIRSKNRDRRHTFGKFISEYKLQKKCEKCGYCKCPSAMDFHHKDMRKDFGGKLISRMREFSKENILKELEKCIVLCSNCHRELHYSKGVTF